MEMVSGEYSYDYCQYQLMDMTNKICELFAELGIGEIAQQLQHKTPREFHSIVQYRDWLSNWIAEAYAVMEESRFAKEVQLIDKAEEYILAHLSEDISVGDVAAALYVSERHFSRFFKKE